MSTTAQRRYVFGAIKKGCLIQETALFIDRYFLQEPLLSGMVGLVAAIG
jgi:hypothetical protein